MGRRTNKPILNENKNGGYLIPEVQIRDFILNVGPMMARPVLSLLSVALETLTEPVDGALREQDLYLLRELKTAHICPSYQRFLDVVVNSADKGEKELLAAYRTVNHALELAPTYQPDDETIEMIRLVRLRAAERLAAVQAAQKVGAEVISSPKTSPRNRSQTRC